MAITRRKVRLRQTAIRRGDGSWDFEAIFNRELYPAINSIEELFPGTGGSLIQTRNGEIIWYPAGGTGSLLQTFNDGLPTWTTSLPLDENRSLIWDPTTEQWGASNHQLRTISVNTAPSLRLSFATRSLSDTSGNGLDATVESGTERYTYITPTIGGFLFDGATVLTVAGSQPLLALTGAMTCALFVIINTRGAQQFLIGYEDASLDADPNNNTLWGLFYQADGSITYTSESGAGVNADYTINSYVELGQPSLVGFTRYADGTVQHFVNRGLWGPLSTPLTTPTGGSNSRFRVGGREGVAAPFQGTMCSVCVWGRSFTEQEWIDLYNDTFGYYSGFVP